jgi:hypothetical protein
MKKRVKGILGAIVLLLSAGTLHAATVWHTGVLTYVYPLSDGQYVLGFGTILPVCFGSGSGSYLYITAGQNGVTAEGAKNLIATALMAFASGKTLDVAYDDSTAYCYINRFAVR